MRSNFCPKSKYTSNDEKFQENDPEKNGMDEKQKDSDDKQPIENVEKQE